MDVHGGRVTIWHGRSLAARTRPGIDFALQPAGSRERVPKGEAGIAARTARQANVTAM